MRLRSRFAAVLLAAVVVSTASKAQTPSAGSLKAILAAARARVEKSDIRATGRLVAIAGNGARTNNNLALASHSFPDGLRTMVTITTPDHKSIRYLLLQDTAGHTSIESFRKGDAAPVKLSPEHWGEGVAGTDFYPEDFVDGQFFWSKQTVLPPQKYGARDCFLLKSEPGAGQPSVYASVTTWLDQKTGAPVYVEAVPKSGDSKKEFVFYSIEQIGGAWLSRQVEAKVEGKPGSSMLLIEHGSPHAHLQRKDFNLTGRSGPTGSDTGP